MSWSDLWTYVSYNWFDFQVCENDDSDKDKNEGYKAHGDRIIFCQLEIPGSPSIDG